MNNNLPKNRAVKMDANCNSQSLIHDQSETSIREQRVAIIIPCYNEAENIIQVIDDICSAQPSGEIWQPIVVNDCSIDNTAEIVRNDQRAILLDLPCNLGVGAAVQTGFKYAVKHNFDYAVKFDGDGQHRAGALVELLKPLQDNVVDMTIGSRFINPETGGFQSTMIRRVGIRWLRLMVFVFTGYRASDPTSGLRAYSKNALNFAMRYYPSFDYPEPEEIILMRRNGFTIADIYTTMNERQGGVSSISSLKSIYYMLKVSFAMFMIATRPKEK
jgi:glycosyltransferase involved in cell wall biosynthesis